MSDIKDGEIHIFTRPPKRTSTLRIMAQVFTSLLAICGSTAVFLKTARDTGIFEKFSRPETQVQASAVSGVAIPATQTTPVAPLIPREIPLAQPAKPAAKAPVVEEKAASPDPVEHEDRIATGQAWGVFPALQKQTPMQIPLAMDRGQKPLNEVVVVPALSGVSADPLEEKTSLKLGGKATFRVSHLRGDKLREECVEVDVQFGAVSGNPVLSVSTWLPVAPSGKPVRTRLTAEMIDKAYIPRINKDIAACQRFIDTWRQNAERAVDAAKASARRELSVPGAPIDDVNAEVNRIGAVVRSQWQKEASEAEKQMKMLSDRLAGCRVTKNAVNSIQTKAKISYKCYLPGKDGEMALIGQSK